MRLSSLQLSRRTSGALQCPVGAHCSVVASQSQFSFFRTPFPMGSIFAPSKFARKFFQCPLARLQKCEWTCMMVICRRRLGRLICICVPSTFVSVFHDLFVVLRFSFFASIPLGVFAMRSHDRIIDP